MSSPQLSVAMQLALITVNGNDAQIPLIATAVALNVTVVNPEAAGFVTVWPCSAARPNASEDNDADGVQNYADMFPEDGTKSADLDYDGVPDESDVSDDRVKFDNLNFDYPDAIEYITPSMYQGE